MLGVESKEQLYVELPAPTALDDTPIVRVRLPDDAYYTVCMLCYLCMCTYIYIYIYTYTYIYICCFVIQTWRSSTIPSERQFLHRAALWTAAAGLTTCREKCVRLRACNLDSLMNSIILYCVIVLHYIIMLYMCIYIYIYSCSRHLAIEHSARAGSFDQRLLSDLERAEESKGEWAE